MSSLVSKLDKVFSQYIRRSHADEGGTVRCVTCPALMFWKEADCGHWVKRQHMSVRWDERNVGPQCTRCNHFNGGRQDEFSGYIIKRYGVAVHDELLQLKHQQKKWVRFELEEKVNFYTEKLSGLPS